MSIFEKASRQGLRIQSTKGPLMVEQLWHLPLTSTNGFSLNDLAKASRRAIREMESDDDFIGASENPAKAVEQLRLEIIVHILSVKDAEAKAKTQAKVIRQEVSQLEEAMAARRAEALASLSQEQIEKRIAELNAAAAALPK